MAEAAETAQAPGMSDALKKAIKQRGGHRATVTKCLNKIEGVANSDINPAK